MRNLLLIVCSTITIVLCSCTTDNSVANLQNSASVKTVITGRIVDEQGNAIEGVQIKIGSVVVKTNPYGIFITNSIDVPSERLFIIAEKSGYFKGYRAETPIANGVTPVLLKLQSNTPQGSFSAVIGKTITLLTKAVVVLPPNGYVLANGSTYSGDVHYAVKYLDPESQNFYDFFAGDFQAKSVSGDIVQLLSYGVLKVELTSDNGQMVNLAPGSSATLKVPIPSSMQSLAPVSLPLWSFDESIGMWKEEFIATKSGEFYQGQVTHFTDWNFDAPNETGTVRLKVVCNNKALSSVTVRIGQKKFITGDGFTTVYKVPANIPLVIKVYPEDNNGLETGEVVLTLNRNQTKDVELVPSNCPALVIGNVVACNSTPIDASIVVEYNDGTFGYGFAHNGIFSMFVKPYQNVRLKAFAADGTTSNYTYVPQLISQENYNAGYLYCCDGNVVQWSDFLVSTDSNAWALPSGISSDGSTYFTFQNGTFKEWNTLKGNVVNVSVVGRTTDLSKYGKFYNKMQLSDDNRIALLQMNDSTYVTYDVVTHSVLYTFDSYSKNVFLSPNGEKVLFQEVGYIVVRNSISGSIILTLKSINGFTVDGDYFVTDFLDKDNFGVVLDQLSDSVDKTFYLINSTTGLLTSKFAAKALSYFASSSDAGMVVLSPEVSTVQSITLTVYNVRTGLPACTLPIKRKGYTPIPPVVCTPDGKHFVAYLNDGTTDKYVGVFSATTGQLQWRCAVPVNSRITTMSISRDGKTLAGIFDDSKGGVWCRVWKL